MGDEDISGYIEFLNPRVFVHEIDSSKSSNVSISTENKDGNGASHDSAISANGRYVVFESKADNLVSGDTNSNQDIFIRDRLTPQTKRVSVSTSETEGLDDDSFDPSISASGRFVAFSSLATNLVSEDTNGKQDIFVHDIETSETTRVSMASGVEGNGDSSTPSISADGRYIVFKSEADNLVSGDTNNMGDIFVHDRITGDIARANSDVSEFDMTECGVDGISAIGGMEPLITGDGRYVFYDIYTKPTATLIIRTCVAVNINPLWTPPEG